MFFNSSLAKQQLSGNEVHLWILTPKKITCTSKLASLKTLLSHDELKKVQAYRLPKAQKTALITRAFVRSVLALYNDQQAQDLTFTITSHGKPELSNSPIPLRFNLSHNDELIICAVCLEHDIGCDIESLYRKISVDSIAKRYFSDHEYQALKALPQTQKQTRFFEYWTLKEAFVKAMGVGISLGLDTFSFHIENAQKMQFNDNIRLTFAENSPLENQQNFYNSLSYPDETHCIAICVNRKNVNQKLHIKQFQADQYLYQS